MKAIYLDCFSGISGNMLLGAFLQAGVPASYLADEIAKVIPAESFTLHTETVHRGGIVAPYVEVHLPQSAAHTAHAAVVADQCELASTNMDADATPRFTPMAEAVRAHEASQIAQSSQADATNGDAQAATHGKAREDTPSASHAHAAAAHRTMAEIRALLTRAPIAQRAKETALSIFAALADAEGKVHGVPADEVCFHEVGATDSVVDIVGTALALEYLEIEKVFVSRVNTGHGTVRCAHGILPVPAPATAELLCAFPFYQAGAAKELTTPTGAAVLRALATYSKSLPESFVVERIAYGAGSWETEIPNVLRVYIGDLCAAPQSARCILQANIDDMCPQDFDYVFDRLFAAGALDVWTTPVLMKKNRPAVELSVLIDAEQKADCIRIIFEETTSIGLRVLRVDERPETTRKIARVATAYGDVACKVSAYNGKIVSVSAEYDDCRRLAEVHGVPLKTVRQAALRVWAERMGE